MTRGTRKKISGVFLKIFRVKKIHFPKKTHVGEFYWGPQRKISHWGPQMKGCAKCNGDPSGLNLQKNRQSNQKFAFLIFSPKSYIKFSLFYLLVTKFNLPLLFSGEPLWNNANMPSVNFSTNVNRHSVTNCWFVIFVT